MVSSSTLTIPINNNDNKYSTTKKNRTGKIVDFAVLADRRSKFKENEKDKCLDVAQGLKKLCDFYTNCNWCSWYSHQRTNKGTGGIGNRSTSRDPPNYSIIEIG